MKTISRRVVAFPGLAVLFAAGLAGCGGDDGGGGVGTPHERADGSSLSRTDREAAEFVRGKVEEHWLATGDGWTTRFVQRNLFGQAMGGPDTFRQVRELRFTLQPDELTEAQKLNGSDYRAIIDFDPSPERTFHPEESYEGPAGWSTWKDSDPAFAFPVERRHGQWLIGDAALFEGERPAEGTVPAGG